MRISLTVHDERALQVLASAEGRLGDLTPIMTAIAGEVDDRVQRAFTTKTDPVTLTPWAPLKPATIRERVRKGFNGEDILQRTRTLRGGIAVEPDSRGVSVHRGPVEYSLVHFYGSAKKNIPARRFAGASPQDIEQFEDMLARYIIGP